MLSFETFPNQETVEDPDPVPKPHIEVVESGEQYGKFLAAPLPKGYGMTLGNPLRRALYNSLPGTAVTWVKIEGVLHEYGTIPHVKEEVAEFLLNVKDVRLRSEVDRPGKLRLDVAGQGEVSAGDIMAPSDFEIVNPELHLATMGLDEARLSVEFNVERGVGYAEASHSEGLPIGVLPIDAIYSPIKKVNYTVNSMRVGQRTDFEQLEFEIWTDGSITPIEAIQKAGSILVEHFFIFANTHKVSADGSESSTIALTISPEQYNIPVERLEISSRTLNCLKRAGIDKVGEVLEMKKSDLLEIKNFGEKSLNELYDRLGEMDLLPEDLAQDAEVMEGKGATTEDGDVEVSVQEDADPDRGDHE
jgi:DNA-directed RNA polymerase subunit alpha